MPQLIKSALWRRLLMGGARVVPWIADLGLTALRVFMGLALALAHGWGKVYPSFPSDGAVSNADSLGLPAPLLFGALSALAEFLCGLLLALGLFARPAALVIAINMAVAAFAYHWWTLEQGFGNMERALLFFAIAVAFIFVGSGRFSVDRLLR
ncbi:MAG: DoxX family protein [Phycisphaeraceae bacterium]